MRHKNLKILVSSYLDEEVKEDEKAKVLAHLEECSECRQFIEHAKLIRKEICALGEVKLDDYFASRVASSAEEREEQALEWLGIEPLARNTFILLTGFVLIMFFFTSFSKDTTSSINDPLLNRISSNSVSTKVLLQKDNLSKSDLLYAVMTK